MNPMLRRHHITPNARSTNAAKRLSSRFLLLALTRIFSAIIGATLLGGAALNSLAADLRPPTLVSDRIAAVSLSEYEAKLRKTAPREFTIVSAAPFIVLGDDSPEKVKREAEVTVRWAVRRLKQEYFISDPPETISIWLFKNEESYRRNAKAIFNDTPPTPFGYFSPTQKALIMNIASGNGTLVHEIVHPFIHANFPDCPPWFNEGLASLYEQCTEKDGRIRGQVNWRLAELEKAIKEDQLIPFERLTALNNFEFYGKDANPNYGRFYAQSRYLCFYLQEKGLLSKFYHAFKDNAKTDPTGFATLKTVLGETDMEAFQKNWEKFILGLHYP